MPHFDEGVAISIYLSICLYARLLVSGPDFRVFDELISGSGRVNKRTGSSETTCFCSAKWKTAFCGKSIIIRKWWNRVFRKRAVLRFLAHFFGHPSRRVFFLVATLLPLGKKVEEVDTRETLRNKAFQSDFASFYLLDPF